VPHQRNRVAFQRIAAAFAKKQLAENGPDVPRDDFPIPISPSRWWVVSRRALRKRLRGRARRSRPAADYVEGGHDADYVQRNHLNEERGKRERPVPVRDCEKAE